MLFLWFPHIVLPVLTPPFAAGAFAKEKEQRTWQDLFLTTLTTQQILMGKFLAAYFPILVVLATLLTPVTIGYMLNVEAVSLTKMPGMATPDFGAEAIVLGLKCVLQTVFYVLLAFVCSHYCKTARVALGTCYVSLAVYAILTYMLINSIDSSSAAAMSDLKVGVGETMHLLTCGILAVGFWVLLSVGLRFRAE